MLSLSCHSPILTPTLPNSWGGYEVEIHGGKHFANDTHSATTRSICAKGNACFWDLGHRRDAPRRTHAGLSPGYLGSRVEGHGRKSRVTLFHFVLF